MPCKLRHDETSRGHSPAGVACLFFSCVVLTAPIGVRSNMLWRRMVLVLRGKVLVLHGMVLVLRGIVLVLRSKALVFVCQ